MGCKTVLTDEVREKILTALELGNYPTVAARLAGVSRAIFYRWLQEGKAGKSPELESFYHAVKEAESSAEGRAVEWIMQAGANGDTRATSWFLERRHPTRWGVRHAIEVRVNERVSSELTLAFEKLRHGLDAETFDRVAGLLADAGGAIPDGEEPDDPVGDDSVDGD